MFCIYDIDFVTCRSESIAHLYLRSSTQNRYRAPFRRYIQRPDCARVETRACLSLSVYVEADPIPDGRRRGVIKIYEGPLGGKKPYHGWTTADGKRFSSV